MKGVAQLLYFYFLGRPGMRWTTVLGVALTAYSLAGIKWLPPSFAHSAIALIGAGLFLLGSSLMPTSFWSLLRGRQIHLLPYGLAKLLGSALFATCLVSLPIPVATVFAINTDVPTSLLDASYAGNAALLGFLKTDFFWRMYVAAFLTCSWMYVIMWGVEGGTRGGLARGLIALIAMMSFPFMLRKGVTLLVPVTFIVLTWTWFTAHFLFRLRSNSAPPNRGVWWLMRRRHVAGREFDLLIGTDRPWTYSLALIPFVLMLLGSYSNDKLKAVFHLAVFGTLLVGIAFSVGVAGQAAPRCRFLWLRTTSSRDELFSKVEPTIWRHNCYALGVMLLMFTAIGLSTNQSMTTIALRIPGLLLAVAASNYVGLSGTHTHALHWPETARNIGTMLFLIAISYFAIREETDVLIVVALDSALLMAAIAFRQLAKRRWATMDWMLCKPIVRVEFLRRAG